MAKKQIPALAATRRGAKTKRQLYITIFAMKIKDVIARLALWGLLPIGFASRLVGRMCEND